MNIDRLTRLRDLLRADAANQTGVKFDLSMWVGQSIANSSSASHFYNVINGKPEVAPTMSCDTFACALGLACLDPSFQTEGLGFILEHQGFSQSAMVPQFDGETHFEAGAKFFGISNENSSYLFDPENYDDTPKEAEGELFVAQRVDDLINGIIDRDYHPDYRYHDEEED
jgi:hypothetical protein